MRVKKIIYKKINTDSIIIDIIYHHGLKFEDIEIIFTPDPIIKNTVSNVIKLQNINLEDRLEIEKFLKGELNVT